MQDTPAEERNALLGHLEPLMQLASQHLGGRETYARSATSKSCARIAFVAAAGACLSSPWHLSCCTFKGQGIGHKDLLSTFSYTYVITIVTVTCLQCGGWSAGCLPGCGGEVQADCRVRVRQTHHGAGGCGRHAQGEECARSLNGCHETSRNGNKKKFPMNIVFGVAAFDCSGGT
eukprot:1161625-Pelagomonas_calceolata.AAC.25